MVKLTKKQKRALTKGLIMASPYVGVFALINHLSDLFLGKPAYQFGLKEAYECLLELLSAEF